VLKAAAFTGCGCLQYGYISSKSTVEIWMLAGIGATGEQIAAYLLAGGCWILIPVKGIE